MRGAVFVLLMAVVTSAVNAESPEVALAEGDPAPAFEALSVSGEVWKSDEHISEKSLLWCIFIQRTSPTDVLAKPAPLATIWQRVGRS
jgi:hypothetical protein